MLGHLVSVRYPRDDDHFTRGTSGWFEHRPNGQAGWLERLFTIVRRHLPR